MRFFVSIAIIFLTTLFSGKASAQALKKFGLNLRGVTVGYRSSFLGMEAYKDIKGFYNENRPWLDKELSTSAAMHGLEVGIGTTNEKGGIAMLSFAATFNKDVAKGSYNGVEYKRLLKSRYFGMETIDIWLTPIHWKGFNIGGGLMPLGMHLFTFTTKLNGEKPELGPYSENAKMSATDVFLKLAMNHNIHLDITRGGIDNGRGVHFQLFYQFASDRRSKDNELLLLNKEVNPNSYEGFNKRSLMKADYFGIKLMLLF